MTQNRFDRRHLRWGCFPIIDRNTRSGKVLPMEPDRARRYNNRTAAERFNSELKDNHGFFDGAGKGQQESACA